MASNSASHLATQQSIKAYVDAEVAGNTRALSPPVASAADNIVSFASAVEPSNII